MIQLKIFFQEVIKLAELVVSKIIKIILVVLLIVVVLVGVGIKMEGSVSDFFKNLPGEKKVTPPLSCEEYCSFECTEEDCNDINNQWKEYYKEKGFEEIDTCFFNKGICSTIK